MADPTTREVPLPASSERSTPGPLASLQPRSVAVFRALQLGDMLCAVPALRALRRALPRSRVTLVGLPWARAFAARFTRYIDDFLPVPGHPGLPEQPPDRHGWPAFLAHARARRFDLAIQMHGNGSRTNALVALLDAGHQAGFAPDDSRGLFLRWPEHGTETQRLLQLMHFLGAPLDGERLEFPLVPQDFAEWEGYPRVRTLAPGRYICVHPGARAADRRWPPSHFAAVADALARNSGLQVVLTGSEHETALTRAVAAAMHAPAVDAAAPVSVGALAALIAGSRLLVGNDTGTSHIAAALQVPSVIVFLASDPQRWAPPDRARHRAVWDPQARRVGEVVAQARALLGAPS